MAEGFLGKQDYELIEKSSELVTSPDLPVTIEGQGDKDGVVHLDDQAAINSHEFPQLIAAVNEAWERAKEARMPDEARWLKSLQNYRGVYDEATLSRIPDDKSKVFVKITKTKVLAAYGQLIEVLLGTGKFPLGIEPTKVPEGVAEYVHIDGQPSPDGPTADVYGYAGDGKTIAPGTTQKDLLNGLETSFGGLGVKPGPTDDPNSIQIEPANIAAKNMEKKIHDQLDATNAANTLRHVAFEMVLLGHGVIKGPFNSYKIIHNWEIDENGKRVYKPIEKLIPDLEPVSIWDFYPDPNCNGIDNGDYIVHRHKFNRSQMRGLVNKPYFRETAIQTCLLRGPNHEAEWWETELKDADIQEDHRMYQVLEYWGTMDARTCVEAGLDPVEIGFDEDKPLQEVQINVWACGDQILRLVLNPFTPTRIPYLACPYEIHPYQFFGMGVPENMEDAQQIMNGHARAAIDNLILSGNVVLEMDDNLLVPGQDMRLTPGKIFHRQGGQSGQSIHAIQIPNVAPDHMNMFDRFRQLADEETGIPSYSHGQTGVQSTTRTASGMSMLMGAAALNIKTVVKNLDDFLLQPLGEALYAWNMQFEEDETIHGDFEVKARGTAALMQKEVRSQRLMMFMQVGANPQLAPLIKWTTVLKELAETLDIDPDKFINNPEEAKIYAQIMANAQGLGQETTPTGEQPASMGGPPTGSSGPAPLDPSGNGGGTIGTSAPPMPREAGFSAASNGASGQS